MKFFDLIKISFDNITRKRLQTFLTSIGIAIGVSLIFILISISRGLEYTVRVQLEKLGSDAIIITAGRSINFGFLSFNLRDSRNTFTENLINKLKNLHNVKYILPIGRTSVTLRYNYESSNVLAHIVPIAYISNMEYFGFSLSYGRLFDLRDNKRCVLIIGKAVQDFLFSSKINVGDTLFVNEKKCVVIGILNSTGNFIIDYGIFIPYEYYKRYMNTNFSGFSQIYIKLKDYKLGYNEISKFLDKEFGKEYSILTIETLYETISKSIGTVSIFALLLSLVSILVSAIGVANTMFSSVIERKKEIGILKALGMRNIHVLKMFLLESIIIGFFASIFGILIGVFGSKIFEYAFSIYGYNFKVYLGIDLFLISFLIPVFVCIISGFIPAYLASKIDPVEILKSE
ncbi:MAG: FtsX-like permease family protein [Candidatus Aenigmatarchaeota archaeon]